MTPNQLRNILNFTFLFHQVSGHSSFMKSSPDYIWEKYQNMIGIAPRINPSFGWQPSKLNYKDDPDAIGSKMCWYVTWMPEYHNTDFHIENIKNPLPAEIDQVLNYLIMMNRGIFNRFAISGIVDMFREYIGSPEDVEPNAYKHIHPSLIGFIDKYMDQHKRDLTLTLLTE